MMRTRVLRTCRDQRTLPRLAVATPHERERIARERQQVRLADELGEDRVGLLLGGRVAPRALTPRRRELAACVDKSTNRL